MFLHIHCTSLAFDRMCWHSLTCKGEKVTLGPGFCFGALGEVLSIVPLLPYLLPLLGPDRGIPRKGTPSAGHILCGKYNIRWLVLDVQMKRMNSGLVRACMEKLMCVWRECN